VHPDPTSDSHSAPTSRSCLGLVGRGLAWGLLSMGLMVAAGAVWLQAVTLRDLPDVQAVLDYKPPQATRVLDRTGTEIDVLYVERRFWVPLPALPRHVLDAFVAAEDQTFWEHRGVDPQGIARAALANLDAGEVVQGGSTITQQLVKKLLIGSERSLRRKIREAALAYRLERRATKEQLLELYLNYVFLGGGNHGVEAASRDYFGQSARTIDAGQAALLAGLVRAPSRYAPRTAPDDAMERRETVLRQMRASGSLTEAELDAALATPLLGPPNQAVATGGVSYITSARQRVLEVFGDAAPQAGLTVRTALDPAIQAIAEDAVLLAIGELEARREARSARRGAQKDRGQAQGAAVVLHNATGEVLALVGGREMALADFSRAVQARRQPGSAFKPFVYATALQAGWSGGDLVDTSPLALKVGGRWWRPRDHVSAGPIPLRRALALSSNTAAVRLGLELTPEAVAATAQAMGITSPLRPDKALPLGVSEVSPLDMAVGYATVARLGSHVRPRILLDATGPDGAAVPLPEATPTQVLDPGVAYELLDMMRGVVERGTGKAVRAEGRDRAGKTGTTNDAVDTWFVGSTPEHTVAVWIGLDAHDPLGRGEAGGRTAAPGWKAIVDALQGDDTERFPVPPDIVFVPSPAGTAAYRRGTAPGKVLPHYRREDGEPLPPFPGWGR